jgi:hypothetical protein
MPRRNTTELEEKRSWKARKEHSLIASLFNLIQINIGKELQTVTAQW